MEKQKGIYGIENFQAKFTQIFSSSGLPEAFQSSSKCLLECLQVGVLRGVLPSAFQVSSGGVLPSVFR